MPKRRFTSSQAWVTYFQKNAEIATALARPTAADQLPVEIRETVQASLPAWQLGETSDGRHLRAAARQYAETQNDPYFQRAVDLFIKEEQRHGAALGDWLDRVGIPRKQRDMGDSLFRLCRYAIPNYAVWASVVVMVESMAELYYAAVKHLTPCPRLKMECRRILQDEVKHIQFQCEHLAATRRYLPRPFLKLLRLLEMSFYIVVCAAVWIAHGRLFRRSGMSLSTFIRASSRKFRRMQSLMDPARYDFREVAKKPPVPRATSDTCIFTET